MPAASFNTHYICRWESNVRHRHWIRKEDAIMHGTIPICPDCGRRLSASAKQKKRNKAQKPWDIVIDKRLTHPKCLHCKKQMRYMIELEAKGRHGVFECMKCGCIFAWVSSFPVNKTWLTLARGSSKCKTLIRRVNQVILDKIKQKRRKKRKRKRHNKKQREYREENELLCRARVRCSRAKAKQRNKKCLK